MLFSFEKDNILCFDLLYYNIVSSNITKCCALVLCVYNFLLIISKNNLISISAMTNVFDSLFGSLDIISFLIRDFNREFFLNSHNNFNSIQTIKSKILDKMRFESNLKLYTLFNIHF